MKSKLFFVVSVLFSTLFSLLTYSQEDKRPLTETDCINIAIQAEEQAKKLLENNLLYNYIKSTANENIDLLNSLVPIIQEKNDNKQSLQTLWLDLESDLFSHSNEIIEGHFSGEKRSTAFENFATKRNNLVKKTISALRPGLQNFSRHICSDGNEMIPIREGTDAEFQNYYCKGHTLKSKSVSLISNHSIFSQDSDTPFSILYLSNETEIQFLINKDIKQIDNALPHPKLILNYGLDLPSIDIRLLSSKDQNLSSRISFGYNHNYSEKEFSINISKINNKESFISNYVRMTLNTIANGHKCMIYAYKLSNLERKKKRLERLSDKDQN